MYHPHTVIYSNFTFRYKLENIPEPCYIVIDIPDIISIDLPTIFIQLEPNIIIDNENYLLENFHKYERIYTFNETILKNVRMPLNMYMEPVHFKKMNIVI